MGTDSRSLSEAERLWTDDVFRTYYRRIRGTAFQLGKNLYHVSDPAAWSEDMAQEVFLCLTDHIAEKDLMKHPNIGGWLVETLKGKIGNYIQKQGNREVALSDVSPICGERTSYEFEYDAGDDLFPQSMTEREKLLIYRRVCEERPYKDIAKELGVTPTACRMQMHRALAKCRKLKKKQEDSTEFDRFQVGDGGIVQKGGVEHV